MPKRIQEKLFLAKKYTHYVVSKTIMDNYFEFEDDKLEYLLNSYKHIFYSVNGFETTRRLMGGNHSFVSFLCDNGYYKDVNKDIRIRFVNAFQNTESVQDIFDNYDDEFAIEYFSKILGFKDKEAATCFINNLKKHANVAASKKVYDNTHIKLVNGSLKSVYTKLYKRSIS